MIRCIALQYKKTRQVDREKQPRQCNFMGLRQVELSKLNLPTWHGIPMEMNEEVLEVNSRTFRVNYAQFENAVVAFFFEDRMRIGTLAIAMPGTGEVAVGRSSVLVGGKYLMTSRALAERLAGKSGRIALVSLFTELDEAEAFRVYAKLLDKVQLGTQSGQKSLRPDTSIRQNI